MTIENLKQIAIKYASTKGSRIPLAPDELCNAVVQYMNSFFGVMTDINTIKVAVTEDSGNIVFTITGNTYDGKPITPIVITVDHNDFVTDQEFEAFKTTTNAAIQKNTESINSLSFRVEDTENDITTIQVQVGQIKTRVGNTETNIAKINSTLNNKLDKISSVSNSNQVYGKSAAGENLMYNLESHPNAGYVLQYDSDGNIYVNKGSSEYTPANMQNISDVEAKIPDVTNLATKDELNNKLDKSNWNATVYIVDSSGVQNNVGYTSNPSPNTFVYRDDNSNFVVNSPTENGNPTPKSYVDNALTNLADVTKENTFAEINTFNKRVYFKEIHFDDNDYNIYNTYANNQGIYSKYVADVSENMYNIKELGLYYYCLGTVTNDGMFHEFLFPNEGGTLALTSDIPAIPEYTSVDSVIYDTTNGAIIAYNGANEIHIPLLAGENVTIDASEDNKKIVISAAGGGGTGDVTAAGNNTFTGVNTFNNSIYAKNGIVAEDTTNYGANSVRKGPNTYSFPNKSGTFAMTSDVIKNPIYFISFYANEPSEPCHLIGTMMSKTSYGTGQKTNEEFAVMLADNFYRNSNEGLAAYGKLAEKDILCIYSEDGLSIRCLDEANSEVDLPTVMFFVMET